MSEECQDASIVLPRALIWSVVPNGIMAFIMGTTFIFCIGDIDDVLASPTGEPFVQVFFNATQSYAGTTIMTLIIMIMLTSACISEVATASRQLWSFVSGSVAPFSGFLRLWTDQRLGTRRWSPILWLAVACLAWLEYPDSGSLSIGHHQHTALAH